MRKSLLFALVTATTVASAQSSVAPHIVEVHAAGPGVLTVVLESSANETGPTNTPDTLDLTPSRWTVNGLAVTNVYRNSAAWDADKRLTSGATPTTVRHRIYLPLTSSLQEGMTYQLATPYGPSASTFRNLSTFCESIKVNQVGYAQGTTVRYANFGAWMGNGGTLNFSTAPSYQVVRDDGSVVLQAQGIDRGTDTLAGEHVYRLSLSSVPEGGPYRVMIPSCGVSRPFGIGASYAAQSFETVMRFFYYQRCGDSVDEPYAGGFPRAVCHSQMADTRTALDSNLQKPGGYGITIPTNAPTVRMRGSWHDAGNFQRRPEHSNISPAFMTMFEAFPDHFRDCQYSTPIPECGNGMPDFLDEALYGVLGWENLQIKDTSDPLNGCVRSGTMEQRQPNYGVDSSESNPQVIGNFQVTDYVTLRAAGMFAQASRMVRRYNSTRADQYRSEALAAFACVTRGKPSTFLSTPDAGMLYASLQMYFATGDPSYHNTFQIQATQLLVMTQPGIIPGTWPQQYIAGNRDSKVREYHFVSYALANPPYPVDTTLRDALRFRITDGAASGGYMAPAPEASPYPYGTNKFFAWGKTTAQGELARPYIYASLWISSTLAQQYRNYVSEYADHDLGLTPEGQSFCTGLGTDQPRSPLHLDSYWPKYGVSDGLSTTFVGHPRGNIPGLLVYGPNDAYPGYDYQMAATNKFYPVGLSRPVYHQYLNDWASIARNEFTMHETEQPEAEMLAFLLPSTTVTPPPNDAGTPTADGSTDASADARADTGTDTGIRTVCIQPPVPLCGPQVFVDAGL